MAKSNAGAPFALSSIGDKTAPGSKGEKAREPQSNVNLAETLAFLPIRNGLLRNAEPFCELSLSQTKPRPHLADLRCQRRDFLFRGLSLRTLRHDCVSILEISSNRVGRETGLVRT